MRCDTPCPQGSYGLNCLQKCKVLIECEFSNSMRFHVAGLMHYLYCSNLNSFLGLISVVINQFATQFLAPALVDPGGKDHCNI